MPAYSDNYKHKFKGYESLFLTFSQQKYSAPWPDFCLAWSGLCCLGLLWFAWFAWFALVRLVREPDRTRIYR